MHPKVPYFLGISLAIICLAFELMSTGCDFTGDALMGKSHGYYGDYNYNPFQGCQQFMGYAEVDPNSSPDCSGVNITSMSASSLGVLTIEMAELTNGQYPSIATVSFVHQNSSVSEGGGPSLNYVCAKAAKQTPGSVTYSCDPPLGIHVHPTPIAFSDRVYGFGGASSGSDPACGSSGLQLIRPTTTGGCSQTGGNDNDLDQEWNPVSIQTTPTDVSIPYLWVSEPDGGWPNEGETWPVPAAGTQPLPAPSPSPR